MKNPSLKGDIRDKVSLEEFARVFSVFKGYPFREMWTDEEIKDEYESFYKKGGYIFGYFVNDECVSILTLHPRTPGEHPVEFDKDAKVMYLSDVATLDKFRNHGIGTDLFHHAIKFCTKLGYNYIYLRTNYDVAKSMSANIAKKCGFERIYDVCQEVERKRIDGKTKKDLRMFMRKKLGPN